MVENFIKVWGIERAGTVYTQQMINRNIESVTAMSNAFGWKHGPIPDTLEWLKTHKESSEKFWNIYREFKEDGIGSVIVIKNPYSWFGSIRRYCKRFKGYQPFNPAIQYERYNRLYLHWWDELITKRHPFFSKAKVVRYEDMLRDIERQMTKIASIHDARLHRPLKVLRTVEMSSPFNEQDRKRYLEVDVPKPQEVDLVNRMLSDELFKLYEYERI